MNERRISKTSIAIIALLLLIIAGLTTWGVVQRQAALDATKPMSAEKLQADAPTIVQSAQSTIKKLYSLPREASSEERESAAKLYVSPELQSRTKEDNLKYSALYCAQNAFSGVEYSTATVYGSTVTQKIIGSFDGVDNKTTFYVTFDTSSDKIVNVACNQ